MTSRRQSQTDMLGWGQADENVNINYYEQIIGAKRWIWNGFNNWGFNKWGQK
jgi:hypothetical protein